jgi:hypothetical protein
MGIGVGEMLTCQSIIKNQTLASGELKIRCSGCCLVSLKE